MNKTDLLAADLANSPQHARQAFVLHVRVMTGYGGGPEKTILNSPRFLQDLGYASSCAYMHPSDDPGFKQLQKRATVARADLISIPDQGPFDWRVVRELVKICRAKKVDVWHGHDYKSNAIGLLVRRFWKMKLVTTLHGWVERTSRTPLYYWIDKICLRRYEQIVCVSEDLLQACHRLGIADSRCHLIHNGIDTEEFRRKSRPDSRPGRTLRLSAVGRLSPEKGFDLLIQALAALRGAGRDVRLKIAGEGRDRDRLNQLIAKLEMQAHIELVGFVDDPKSFLEQSDVFVLSSLREGLPNVLLEAMSLEVPVVATSIAGVPQLIQNEANGLLISPNSVDELSMAISRFMDDGQLRASLAAAGRETIERDYGFRQRMQRIARVYDSVLENTK